jgi:prepilin-type N-terminal cleavage/methylation domain-containing protein
MPTFTQSSYQGMPYFATKQSIAEKGFTLIEMMVVVVLMGLVASVALPNFERWFASTQQRVEASRIAMQVQNLLARAAILNQSLDLTSANVRQILADGKPALDLPTGWSMRTSEVLAIYGSGYCVPAEINFVSNQNQKVGIQIRDQQCNVGFTLQGGPTPKP